MSKIENHKQDLAPLFVEFFATGDASKLTAYIVTHSALPGPRGNLELAAAFGDTVEQYAPEKGEALWRLCATMTETSADAAPVNDPREFIPVCGTVGLGAIGSAAPAFLARALVAHEALANDLRWRTREAVCMGLQRLLARRGKDALAALQEWAARGSPFVMRAAAAAVAEPALLKDAALAQAALQLHRDILARALKTPQRKSEGFRVLRQGLGYTVSVVVCALPEEGFALMRQLAATHDADALWIVKENLKKNRLVKRFPSEVEAIRASLK